MATENDNRLLAPLPGAKTNILMNPAFQRQNEETIRRIVREEMLLREKLGKMSHHNLTPRLQLDQKIPSQYRLQFMNKVTNTTFTNNLVRDDNGHPMKVAIHDTYIKSIISPDNFLSSAKVKIIVLNAEFVETKGEAFSRGEFDQSVLRERERKGPILTGRSLIIQLENGVGTFENIVFNDNSSWTKSGFRLGVMVVSDGEEGYLNGERVQEGVSEPFRVKDRRVKAQKPELLNPKHSVQCIKKIGKHRASFLEKKNIKTVEDFLHIYFNNEPELRNILRINSESDKEWESMVEHVKQCADELHTKCNVSNNSSQPCQPMEKNSSLCTKVGHCVASWGSSKPNPSEKDIIEAGIPICPSKNLSNEPISTAYGERIVDMQKPLFREIGEVELTNDGGFPHDQPELLFDTSYYNPDIIMDGSGNPDIIMDGSGNPDFIMDGSGNPDIIMDGSGNYWSGRSFTGRKVGMAVPGLEDLLLEESQTGGYSGIFQENRPE